MSKWLWRTSLLLFPLALLARLVWPKTPTVIFCLAALSLMPLAKSIGDATEELAERVGPTLGSLLNVTFGNAQPLRDAAAAAPADLILAETDAPFLTPMPYRGQPNAPYLVPLTVRAIAAVQQRTEDEVATGISETAARVFGWA